MSGPQTTVENVRVFDGHQESAPRSVWVADGVFVDRPAAGFPADTPVVQARGWVVSRSIGLVDQTLVQSLRGKAVKASALAASITGRSWKGARKLVTDLVPACEAAETTGRTPDRPARALWGCGVR